MRIGLITESKNDYEALKSIVSRILQSKQIEFEGAFGHGCGEIISQKKVFSNKLKNQKCDAVIIVRDSDGADPATIKSRLEEEYSYTSIKDIFSISIAIEELEAWFMGDIQCLRDMYEINKRTKITIAGKTDDFNSPKEQLKNFIHKSSKGVETYVESDSQRLAKLLNIDIASSNSMSFREFRNNVERVGSLAA